jgi:hypothetical protein
VSRKLSFLRLEDAAPGTYYVMLEALADLSDVVLTTTVRPASPHDVGGGHAAHPDNVP